MKKEYKYGMDLLRLYCCFCIIGIHVSGCMNDYSTITYKVIQGIVRPPLWAFLTLTGFLTLSHTINNKIIFFIKHIISLVVPVFVYVFLYHYYYCKTWRGYNPFGLFIEGDPIGHLWYVLMIIPLYVVIPFLKKMLDALNTKEIVGLLGVALILIRASDVLPYFGIPIVLNIDGVFNIFIFYLILGYLLQREIKRIPFWIPIIMLVADIVLITYEFGSKYFAQDLCNLSPAMVLGVIALFLLFNMIKINYAVGKVVHYLSRRTYGIYLIHMLPLQYLINDTGIVRKIITGSHIKQGVGVLVVSMLVFLISLLVSIILDTIINGLEKGILIIWKKLITFQKKGNIEQ